MNDARPAVVIGYGNTLRNDDAVGPRAATIVQGWGLPGVTALAVHQLTPELAEPIAAARLAVFVDSRFIVDGERLGVEVVSLEHAEGETSFGHDSNPWRILALGANGLRELSWGLAHHGSGGRLRSG